MAKKKQTQPSNWGKKVDSYKVGDSYFKDKLLANTHSKETGLLIEPIKVIHKKIKVSSGKAKGRDLQKWVANEIGEMLDITVGKDELIESREMGQAGSDVKLIGEAGERFPFAIECKNTESWSVISYIEQAKANIKKDQDWIVFMKKNGVKPVVVMDAKEWFEWMKGLDL